MTSRDLEWEVIPTPKLKQEHASHQLPIDNIATGSCLTKDDLLFIKELKREDKAKIAYLIQQVVRLEQNNVELREQNHNITSKYTRKCELFKELEEYSENLQHQNDKLKSEVSRKDKVLKEYSTKLEETNLLLKASSETHKKLQKRLNIKKKSAQVQTETLEVTTHSRELQTSLSNLEETIETEARQKEVFAASIDMFISKLDKICEKLDPVSGNKENEQPPRPIIVHNHKTNDRHLTPKRFIDKFSGLKDSILVAKTDKTVRFSPDLVDLIDELNQVDDDDILEELFFKSSNNNRY